jgi:hypothetical protein
VQCGNDRLLQRLDLGEQVEVTGITDRVVEFGDVGTGDEGPAGTHQDDCRDRLVGCSLAETILQTCAYSFRQSIDRRTVDRNQRQAAGFLQIDYCTHIHSCRGRLYCLPRPTFDFESANVLSTGR